MDRFGWVWEFCLIWTFWNFVNDFGLWFWRSAWFPFLPCVSVCRVNHSDLWCFSFFVLSGTGGSLSSSSLLSPMLPLLCHACLMPVCHNNIATCTWRGSERQEQDGGPFYQPSSPIHLSTTTRRYDITGMPHTLPAPCLPAPGSDRDYCLGGWGGWEGLHLPRPFPQPLDLPVPACTPASSACLLPNTEHSGEQV